MTLAAATYSLAFIGNLGGPDLLVIALIGLLIFGKRLPEVGKNLGQAIVGFKKGLKEVGEEVREGTESLREPTEAPEAKPNPYRNTVKASPPAKKMLRPASEEP